MLKGGIEMGLAEMTKRWEGMSDYEKDVSRVSDELDCLREMDVDSESAGSAILSIRSVLEIFSKRLISIEKRLESGCDVTDTNRKGECFGQY
jgi:hypothetical protein